MMMDLPVHAPAATQGNFAGAPQKVFRQERRLGVYDVLCMEACKRSDRFHAAMGMVIPGLPRAVPHRGERPSPHQETEAAAPAGNATRSHSNIAQEVPAEILPSDASGKSRIKPSSDGWGRGGQYRVLCQPLRTL